MKKVRGVHVSDHAVLRYLERVGGFDIEGLRHQIAQRLLPAVAAGATGVKINGFEYRIATGSAENGVPVVATVCRSESAPQGLPQKVVRPCR